MSYRIRASLAVRIARSVAAGRRRSLGADATACLRAIRPAPVALDTHYLPRAGPFIVVSNHFERPGLWAGWGAMVVSAMVWQTGGRTRDVHWVMTSELLDLRVGPVAVPRAWVRRVLGRFAWTYGMGLVSPREAGVLGGTGGLRVAARALAARDPVGLLPEGTASLALCEARPGVGRALAWLAGDRVPLVPVGVSERAGQLTAVFGPPFHLSSARSEPAARDRALRNEVMQRIADLLPRELLGYYGRRFAFAQPFDA